MTISITYGSAPSATGGIDATYDFDWSATTRICINGQIEFIPPINSYRVRGRGLWRSAGGVDYPWPFGGVAGVGAGQLILPTPSSSFPVSRIFTRTNMALAGSWVGSSYSRPYDTHTFTMPWSRVSVGTIADLQRVWGFDATAAARFTPGNAASGALCSWSILGLDHQGRFRFSPKSSTTLNTGMPPIGRKVTTVSQVTTHAHALGPDGSRRWFLEYQAGASNGSEMMITEGGKRLFSHSGLYRRQASYTSFPSRIDPVHYTTHVFNLAAGMPPDDLPMYWRGQTGTSPPATPSMVVDFYDAGGGYISSTTVNLSAYIDDGLLGAGPSHRYRLESGIPFSGLSVPAGAAYVVLDEGPLTGTLQLTWTQLNPYGKGWDSLANHADPAYNLLIFPSIGAEDPALWAPGSGLLI